MKYIPFSQAKRYNLIELCACRNMIVHHQKMELFFAFLTVYCRCELLLENIYN